MTASAAADAKKQKQRKRDSSGSSSEALCKTDSDSQMSGDSKILLDSVKDNMSPSLTNDENTVTEEEPKVLKEEVKEEENIFDKDPEDNITEGISDGQNAKDSQSSAASKLATNEAQSHGKKPKVNSFISCI